jgi:hypothetical protein
MAREKLAELDLQGVQEGETSGDFGEERPGYGWQTSASPADVSGLLQVRLRIQWGDPAQPRTVEYVTFVKRRAS